MPAEEVDEAARCPPAAAEEEEEEEELHLAKRRKVLCSEFAAITSSDAAVARSFLAGNGWHMQVRPAAGAGGFPFPFPFPAICLCVSEGPERLFRPAVGEGEGGGGRRGAAGLRGARELVGDPRAGGR